MPVHRMESGAPGHAQGATSLAAGGQRPPVLTWFGPTGEPHSAPSVVETPPRSCRAACALEALVSPCCSFRFLATWDPVPGCSHQPVGLWWGGRGARAGARPASQAPRASPAPQPRPLWLAVTLRRAPRDCLT